MNQLIGNMLSYTRLEQRIDNYPFEKLDFSVLVSDLCSDMMPLRINDISLEYSVEPGIMINGNAELLARMLQNLLENAYKYGRQSGNTKVTLSLQGNNIKLLVEDDGIGIAEDQLKQIFDRFFRVSNKSSITGSGLGLSIVKKIVDMHGGNIDVSSREGLGTTFTITFYSIIR
nr:HAMP domain-containing sensor histidine kinase [uncultured Catonella sp.]